MIEEGQVLVEALGVVFIKISESDFVPLSKQDLRELLSYIRYLEGFKEKMHEPA